MNVRDRKISAKMCRREDFPKRKQQIKKAERSKIRKIIKYEVERKGIKTEKNRVLPPRFHQIYCPLLRKKTHFSNKEEKPKG
jgi:hypothetical protein